MKPNNNVMSQNRRWLSETQMTQKNDSVRTETKSMLCVLMSFSHSEDKELDSTLQNLSVSEREAEVGLTAYDWDINECHTLGGK